MKSYKFESNYKIVFSVKLTDNEESKFQKYGECFEEVLEDVSLAREAMNC